MGDFRFLVLELIDLNRQTTFLKNRLIEKASQFELNSIEKNLFITHTIEFWGQSPLSSNIIYRRYRDLRFLALELTNTNR